MNKKAKILNLFLVLLFIMQISGCDEISYGDQRRKFEFLYKMNNYSTLFREYSGTISYYDDLELYKKRMTKLYSDVSEMPVINGYSASNVLKENFLTTIDSNLRIIQKFDPEDKTKENNIRKDYEIELLSRNADEFINKLNEEITKVGKE